MELSMKIAMFLLEIRDVNTHETAYQWCTSGIRWSIWPEYEKPPAMSGTIYKHPTAFIFVNGPVVPANASLEIANHQSILLHMAHNSTGPLPAWINGAQIKSVVTELHEGDQIELGQQGKVQLIINKVVTEDLPVSF